MFDALRSRLKDLEKAPQEGLLDAAIAVADVLRGKVKGSKKRAAAQRKSLRGAIKLRAQLGKATRARNTGARKQARLEEVAAVFGIPAASIRRRLKVKRGGSSGISILGKATSDSAVVTASNQVHFLRRKRSENAELVAAFREAIMARVKGGA